ncbi:MAG: amidinotransferase [Candidatus Electrothrix sp. AUS1_2]|nr:amidinotransferase [Candidatus Electrothrix sp. AUS1_2]
MKNEQQGTVIDCKERITADECGAGDNEHTEVSLCPVNSHNEWDPLEEVIVGNIENSAFSLGSPQDRCVYSQQELDEFTRLYSCSQPYPEEVVQRAEKALDEFIHILKSEGVIVKQVEPHNSNTDFSTPSWYSPSGFSVASPRDPFLIIGNEILEAPTSSRDRFLESFAYKKLFKEYFMAGAKWTSAPKPQLLDDLYDKTYKEHLQEKKGVFCLTEFEPVFDAADFVRCGRDIFGQLSNVTNKMGVEWLRRHLGDTYKVHLIDNLDPKAWHIDTVFMPLAPGKVLINPEYIDINSLPDILNSWDILTAPQPVPYRVQPKVMSNWISINTLMLDEQRIIVEKRQAPLIAALKNWGFEPIPCSFEDYYPFLGGFHCATLDVRRRGTLQSYF